MTMLLVLLSPFIVAVFGAYVAYHYSLSLLAFSSNIIALISGIPIVILLGKIQKSLQKHLLVLSMLTLVLMLISLWSPGILGVHRWLNVDGYYLNISMIVAPFALFSMYSSLVHREFLLIFLAISFSVIYVLQPDASQSTAFGCAAMIILFCSSGIATETRAIGISSILVGICLSWCQPDKLPAVENVEHILQLAIKIGFIGYMGVGLSLIIIVAPVLYLCFYRNTSYDQRVLVTGFMTYLVLMFCVTGLGNYPVPIMGAGASSILSYYIMIGLLDILHIDQ